MRKSYPYQLKTPAWCLLVLAMLAGCDAFRADDSPRPEQVTIDFGALDALRFPLADEHCMTVRDSVVLRTRNLDKGRESVQGRKLLDGATSAVFENVEVGEGEIQFEAEVYSITQQLLYTGRSRPASPQENFQIEINLEAVAPVMMACPTDVQLEFLAELGAGTLTGAPVQIANVGTGSLRWRISSMVEGTCLINNELPGPCLIFADTLGSVPAGMPDTLFVGSLASTYDRPTYQVDVMTDQGDIPLTITPFGGPF